MADNRTPFDDELLHDPQAPRHTQPLPNAAGNTGNNAANNSMPQMPGATPIVQAPVVQPLPLPPLQQPTVQQPTVQQPTVQQPTAPPFIPTPTVAGGSRPLPPQVVSGKLTDDDDAPIPARLSSNTGRLPTPTLIGLAMAGGALGVTLLSGLIYRTIPRPAVKGLAPATTVATPRPATAPRIVPMPADASSEDQNTSDSGARTIAPAGRAATRNRAASNTPRIVTRPQSDADDATITSGDDSSNGFPNADSTSSGTSRGTSSDNDIGSKRVIRSRMKNDSDAPRTDDSGAVSRAREGRSGAAGNGAAGSVGRDENSDSSASPDGAATRRSGYSITPPAGFRLVQKGRRTIWQGPGGAQILVETAPVGSRSPRRDWERLDARLSKKYGARYRSRGISDLSIAGRSAAAWEFELDGKNGTTRKLDVAVHHNGRGYAVLGSAPAQNFDAMRPQLEAAINSFQIREEAAARASSDTPSRRHKRTAPSDTTVQGETAHSDNGTGDTARDEHYAPGDTARSDGGY